MKHLGRINSNEDIINKGYLDQRLTNLVTRGSVLISADGTQTVGIPISAPNINNLLVYLNGLLLEPTIHYTISSNQITAVDYTLSTGDILSFVYIS